MNNVDFFLKGCQAEAYRYKEWVHSVFCIATLPQTKDFDESKHYPYRLYRIDGYPVILAKDTGNTEDPNDWVYITLNGKVINYEKGENILFVDEGIEITRDDVLNYKESGKLLTTPGQVFFNYYCLISAFKDKVPYVNDPAPNTNKLGEKIGLQLQDNVPSEQRKPDTIYVDEFKLYLNAANSFSGFAGINSPSATKYTMTGNPETPKLKEALFKKHEHELDNPVVIANIEKQLLALDAEHIDADPYKGFYIDKGKATTARKKLHCFQGLQARMDSNKKPRLIKGSLSEEPNVEDFPALVDSIRKASFSRGAMTALGGEAVKFIYRIYGAATIIKEDCKTTLGIVRQLNKKNINNYIGSYIVEKGQPLLLTPENINNYLDKTVIMRSPAFCRADPGGRGYCMKCFGEAVRGHEKSLASYGAAVTSTMNTRFMKAMHVDTLSTVDLDFDNAFL